MIPEEWSDRPRKATGENKVRRERENNNDDIDREVKPSQLP